MHFAFTEQQGELRGAVRQVLERECTVADLRDLAPVPGSDPAGGDDPGRARARWAVLAELGAPGLLVAEAMGGVGLSEVDLIGIEEEAGWFALPEPLAETAAVAVPILTAVAEGTTAASQRAPVWLTGIADGDARAAVGGVDLAAGGLVASTRAIGDGRGRARTPRVLGAATAAVLLLALEIDGTWELHAVAGGDAVTVDEPMLDATRRRATVEWHPSPDTQVAAGPAARDLVVELVDRAATFAAAHLLGAADRMITMAADYARDRHQFGKPIGSFQAVKHLLADARIALEFARPATYRAADSLARGLPGRSHDASMAKALAADAADLAARSALQVHGAIGYTWECDLHFWMKRTWDLSAAWGDAPTHRARVLAAALAARR